MKVAKRADAERAAKAPDRYRAFLFYGSDDGGSRALAKLVGEACGAGAERVDLAPADLKTDPARLSDEAGAISMFGDKSWVLVEPAGDESVAALEALVGTPAGNPVVLIAGALKATSKLLRLAAAHPDILCFESEAARGAGATALVVQLGRAEGLTVDPPVAEAIAAMTGGNRALIASELAKYALFLDAAPDRPKLLEPTTLELLAADASEGDFGAIGSAVEKGDVARVKAELDRLAVEGIRGIPILRALMRRFGGMIGRGYGWPADRAARALSRLLEAERVIKRGQGGVGDLAADEELLTLARQGARGR